LKYGIFYNLILKKYPQIIVQQVDGWYFLLAPSFGKHKHLAVDNVKMLTYYGSVDSGLEDNRATSGGGGGQQSTQAQVPHHMNGVSGSD
jgi:hypothetical protein